MKKLLLLLTVGFACSAAIAQENTSIMFNAGIKSPKALAHPIGKAVTPKARHNSNSTERTTYTTTVTWDSSWFDYYDDNYVSGVEGYYFEVSPDSNLYNPADTTGGNTGYLFCHGLGMSFDPTDAGYYGTSGVTTDPIVQTTDTSTNYWIDSVFILGKYIRNNPTAGVVDSLVVDLIATNASATSGTYLLSYTANALYVPITTDSTPRVADADYMPVNFTTPAQAAGDVWDSITTNAAGAYRYTVPLNAGTVADTDADGFNETYFGLSTPLYVPGGQKVVCFVHFKSGVNYTLGTNVSAANYYHLFGGDPKGTTIWPTQTPHNATTGYAGSYQTGLMSQDQNAYGFPSYMGHNLLFSPFDFINTATATTLPAPFGFEVPWFQFHLTYISKVVLGVNNINYITNVKTYPNPTSDIVNITYSLGVASDVSATLTDVMGQVVDTKTVSASTNRGNIQFSTAALPTGVYLYTLTANGQRTTGRIAVVH